MPTNHFVLAALLSVLSLSASWASDVFLAELTPVPDAQDSIQSPAEPTPVPDASDVIIEPTKSAAVSPIWSAIYEDTREIFTNFTSGLKNAVTSFKETSKRQWEMIADAAAERAKQIGAGGYKLISNLPSYAMEAFFPSEVAELTQGSTQSELWGWAATLARTTDEARAGMLPGVDVLDEEEHKLLLDYKEKYGDRLPKVAWKKWEAEIAEKRKLKETLMTAAYLAVAEKINRIRQENLEKLKAGDQTTSNGEESRPVFIRADDILAHTIVTAEEIEKADEFMKQRRMEEHDADCKDDPRARVF